MSTNRAIVHKGFREAGIIAVGELADAAEFEEGLDLLQGIYSSFFGTELGEPLASVNYGTSGLVNSYAVDEDISPDVDSAYLFVNKRYVLNLAADQTLYLHPNPADGARIGVIDNAGNLSTNTLTLNGNGRQIESNASITLNTDLVNREWFYRADRGDWVRIIDIEADDVSPLPREFDDLLTTALAIRVNPRYGAETAQEIQGVLSRMKRIFRARYKQVTEQNSEIGLTRLPSNRYKTMFSTNKNTFDRGR